MENGAYGAEQTARHPGDRDMHEAAADDCGPGANGASASRLRALAGRTPRPIRFLAVGGVGLVADIVLFTLAVWAGVHPLLAQLVALAIATVVTWRLNRAFTFEASGRPLGEEAMRYAVVTAAAQGSSYLVFAALVMTIFAWLPQAAIVAGAAVGALVSYNGHRVFAFAPRKPAAFASQS
jgi:putative flippase GtrA